MATQSLSLMALFISSLFDYTISVQTTCPPWLPSQHLSISGPLVGSFFILLMIRWSLSQTPRLSPSLSLSLWLRWILSCLSPRLYFFLFFILYTTLLHLSCNAPRITPLRLAWGSHILLKSICPSDQSTSSRPLPSSILTSTCSSTMTISTNIMLSTLIQTPLLCRPITITYFLAHDLVSQ